MCAFRIYEFPMQDTFPLSLKNVLTHLLQPDGFETVGLLLVPELLGDVVVAAAADVFLYEMKSIQFKTK